MKKKNYEQPISEIIHTDIISILAGTTGATGEDVPWAAKKMNQLEEFSFEEEESTSKQ